MPRIEQEAQLGEVREDGSQVLLPEVEVTVKNLRTEVEYDDDDAATADVDSPDTDTTRDDISRSVAIRILKGVASTGKA